MLFVHGRMKNTSIPLNIDFYDRNKKFLGRREGVPFSETPLYRSSLHLPCARCVDTMIVYRGATVGRALTAPEWT